MQIANLFCYCKSAVFRIASNATEFLPHCFSFSFLFLFLYLFYSSADNIV